MNDNALLQVDVGGTTTINSLITGNGRLSVIGTGTVILTNGNNTFSGGTTVNSGILAVAGGGANALNDSILVNSGGTLQWNAPNVLATSSTLSLNGGVANLNGNRDYWGGGITLSNNALVAGNGSTCWFIIESANAIIGTGGGNAGTIASPVVLSSSYGADTGSKTQTIQVDPNTTLTISGSIRKRWPRRRQPDVSRRHQ